MILIFLISLLINGVTPKRKKPDTLAETIAGIVSSTRTPVQQTQTGGNVVITTSSTPQSSKTCRSSMGHSPGKISIKDENIKELQTLLIGFCRTEYWLSHAIRIPCRQKLRKLLNDQNYASNCWDFYYRYYHLA